MRPCHFIVNPKSGSRLNVVCLQRLRRSLSDLGYPVRFSLTRSLEHGRVLAENAKAANASLVAVAGGDGTVRVVLEALAGSDLPILIIPSGTENLLACEFGLDGSIQTTLDALLHGRQRPLDLASINDTHIFMAVAGVGFDGQVIRKLHRARSGNITYADYFWPICSTFCQYQSPHLRVVADGRCISDEPSMVFVGNISRYAGGLGVLPHADGSDGWLDLTVYKYRYRYQLIGHSILTTIHQAHRSKSTLHLRCKEVSISSPRLSVPVQTDGDPGPQLPLHIKIIPAAVKIFTPPPPPGKPYADPVRYYHLRRWLTG